METILGNHIAGGAGSTNTPVDGNFPSVDFMMTEPYRRPSERVEFIATGTVSLADGRTVPCAELGRTKNGYTRIMLADGSVIKTDPAMYREAGSIVPFFDAFPYARVPGMVPISPAE